MNILWVIGIGGLSGHEASFGEMFVESLRRASPTHFYGLHLYVAHFLLKVGPFYSGRCSATTKNMKLLSLKQSQKVARLLKEGKVIIFPTDTVYILLADATNRRAIEKLYRIKKRQPSKPLPLFVRSITAAKRIAFISKKQELYIKKHWPGATTVVLSRKRSSMPLYGVAKDTIALRMPNFRPIQILLRKLSSPLTGTSGNIAGFPSPATLQEALAQFRFQKLKPSAAVDGGKLNGKPSRIIDLTKTPFRILRK